MKLLIMEMARNPGNEEVAPEPLMENGIQYPESQRPMIVGHLSKGLVNDGCLSVLIVGYELWKVGTATDLWVLRSMCNSCSTSVS